MLVRRQIVLTVACALAAWAGASMRSSAAPPAGADYSRRDAPTIRREAQDILSQSRFQERKTLSDRLAEWLDGLFGGWRLPSLEGVGLVGQGLVWLLLVGCAAALLLLLWMLWRVVSRWFNQRVPRPAPTAPAVPFEESATCEELRARIEALVRRGQFRQAAGLLVVLLVRRLQPLGVVRFHRAKTNGDYVREYAGDPRDGATFRQFILTADAVVYGSRAPGREAYERLESLWRQADRYVPK